LARSSSCKTADQRDAEDVAKEAYEADGVEKDNAYPVPDRIAKQLSAMIKHMYEHYPAAKYIPQSMRR
jgi:hypothetical protein